jgi:putative nucleotidyltransferase with HDIG domain
MVLSILPLQLGLFTMWAGATLMQGGPHTRYFYESIAVLTNGVLSMLLIFAMAPCAEIIFRYSTRFKLMELMNLDQPILRELMLNAPGTYHHSLIVSHLVDAGANTLGAQSLLCKVAALYHDVGKVTRPEYFIENQLGGENPHDWLAPSMSALIITTHVKNGLELAQEYGLGREVSNIIREHHGTSVITFFYQKAVDMGENPSMPAYSYPGPKPHSREAAIVMLADAVEASSRTLDDPSSSRLQNHIRTIIKNILNSGQLDEVDLTLKDLDKLTQSFVHVLTGLFHRRIQYPDAALPQQVPRAKAATVNQKSSAKAASNGIAAPPAALESPPEPPRQ